jgi:site-specific recombinase XerD
MRHRQVPRAGPGKRGPAHSLGPAFATHLQAGGSDSCTVQALLGHANLEPTRIHPHVLNAGRSPVRSPLDRP